MNARCTALLLLAWLALAAVAAGAQAPPAGLKGERDYEMVLIHGLGSQAAVWDEVIPFLLSTFDVQTFELTGHGKTRPVADPTIAKEVARLDTFLDEFDLEFPTLVGHGLGGMIALRYALDHPARIHRLILIDTAPRQLADEKQQAALLHLLRQDYDAFVAERALNMSPDPEVTDRLVDTVLRTDSASYIGLLLSTLDYDVTPELKGLSVPMLVVGSEMMFPSSEDSQAILRGVGFGSARSLSFKRIEKSGHYVMLERPVTTSSVLLAFGVTADHHFDPENPPVPDDGDHEGHEH